MKRVVLRVPLVLAVAVLLVAVLGVPLFVHPRSDHLPDSVDVVVVLGPADPARVVLADRLLREGTTDHVLVSVAPGRSPDLFRGITCGGAVECLSPSPFTTRGEVAMLNRAAAEHGWSSALVLTGTSHVTRARMIFRACSDLPVAVFEIPEGHDRLGWAGEYVHQIGGFVKAPLVGCV